MAITHKSSTANILRWSETHVDKRYILEHFDNVFDNAVFNYSETTTIASKCLFTLTMGEQNYTFLARQEIFDTKLVPVVLKNQFVSLYKDVKLKDDTLLDVVYYPYRLQILLPDERYAESDIVFRYYGHPVREGAHFTNETIPPSLLRANKAPSFLTRGLPYCPINNPLFRLPFPKFGKDYPSFSDNKRLIEILHSLPEQPLDKLLLKAYDLVREEPKLLHLVRKLVDNYERLDMLRSHYGSSRTVVINELRTQRELIDEAPRLPLTKQCVRLDYTGRITKENWKTQLEIIRQIGSGVEGNTFLATIKMFPGSQVVVKINHWRGFPREALAHDFAVRHFDYVPALFAHFEDPTPVLIQEYIEGNSLKQMESFERLDAYRMYTIILQLFDLFDKFHTLGFRHNDLHLGNVVWDERRKHIWIIDFGLACLSPSTLLPKLDCRYIPQNRPDEDIVKYFVEIVKVRGTETDEKIFPILNDFLITHSTLLGRQALKSWHDTDPKLRDWLAKDRPIC